MPEVREYVDSQGNVPFRDWLVDLDASIRVRMITTVLRMEAGNLSNAKSVGLGVSELRIDFGPGYRIYFGRDGDDLILLLLGGTKRRQQADIDKAHALWRECKQRRHQE